MGEIDKHINSEERFEKVLSERDIFAIAFGAMIGWGWVILAGFWIRGAGSVGAMIAFAIAGVMIVSEGLIFAELTSAMPLNGGEQQFSMRAMGKKGSFVCTWGIILSYISVTAFEACALPSVLQYIFPNILQGYMYTIAGFDIYASWVAIGSVSAFILTMINIKGAGSAAKLQNFLTYVIAAIGILLIALAVVKGDVANMHPYFENGYKGVLSVAVMTPFMFLGFDVIPQAAEEINVPLKKIGKIMILSIVMAALWYIAIVFAVSVAMNADEIGKSGLVTADAMKKLWNNKQIAANIVIIGGAAGILTSWNSFFIGGSRAICALSEAKLIPETFSKLHPKHKTPYVAILLVGSLSMIAPFFGEQMLTWLTNAGSFGAVVAYFCVAISFAILRKNEPELERPYKIRFPKLVGTIAIILTGGMLILYIPGLPSGFGFEEFVIVAGWIILGLVSYLLSMKSWKKKGYTDQYLFGDIPYYKNRKLKTIKK
ncbi:MAG: amino acid permease [Peptostreptococcus sp.]|uniref:APC family permease n=1 Tax=Peptostreptococcus sp. TaxID=1262 RepID=UPI002FC5E6CB